MAERRPIVLVNGELQELPSGDTLPNSGGLTATVPAKGFAAQLTADQSFTSGQYTKVAFTNEEFDTENAYDAANSRFTVPAELDGALMSISSHIRNTASGLEFILYVIHHNSAGTALASAQASYDNSQSGFVSLGAVQVSTGDYFETWLFANNNVLTIDATIASRFSGFVVSETGVSSLTTPASGFRAILGVNTATSTSAPDIVFGTEQYDTDNGYDPTTGVYTVPAALDGKIMVIMAGCRLQTANDGSFLHISRSTDGGSTWVDIGSDSGWGTQLASTGPIQVATGQQFKVRLYTPSNSTALADERTFFSGFVVSGEGSGGGIGGAATFLELTDSPSSFTGQAGKLVRVNAGANGLEFTDAPSSGGTMTGAEIEAALDTQLGSETWKQGLATPANLNAMSDVAVNTSTLTANDQGAALTYDHATGQWVAGKSGFNTLRLGGGMELIAEYTNLSALASIVLTEASHGIDQYDEIVFQVSNITGQARIRIAADGVAAIFQPIAYWRVVSDTAGDGTVTVDSENGPFIGGNVNNLTGCYGVGRVQYHSDPNVHTIVTAEGGSTSDTDGATIHTGFSVTTSVINAIELFSIASGGFFATGTIRVLGVKKSRQPLEYYGAMAGSPSVSGVQNISRTLGTKFRAGVIGNVVVDVAPGADMTVRVQDGAATVIAEGVILAAETECDLVASTTQTVVGTLAINVVTGGTSAGLAEFAFRGELA